MCDLVIQIFFCLRKPEKHINLGESVLPFLLNNNIADKNARILSVTTSCKVKFTWMAVSLFLGLWVLSCLMRGDGLFFFVLWQTRFKCVLKMLGKITYCASGGSDGWGGRTAASPQLFLHTRVLKHATVGWWQNVSLKPNMNSVRWGGGLGLFLLGWERITRGVCQLKDQQTCARC